MKKFRLNMTSPEGQVFEGDADMVVVRGSRGELGILADHTPFISELRSGEIRVKREGGEEKFPAKGGFIEVSERGVNILVKT